MSIQSCFERSIQDFLFAVKSEPTQHIVIGNVAGDADSIVSAITHAFVTSAQASSRHSDLTPQDFLTPIVSISQRDLETTRPETLLLLKWAGIATNNLLYTDNEIVQARAKQATLVDHNHLALDAYNHCQVVEILDHHKDDEQHQDCQRRHIAYSDGKVLVASTCTLIVESLIEHPVQLQPQSQADLSTLLLGVILIDSVGLREEAGKVTDRDQSAVSFLKERTDWSKSRLPPDYMGNDHMPLISKVFDALQKAKFDRSFWLSLSVGDALRLDYKSFQDNTFGISSVLMAWQDFKEKKDLRSGLSCFLNDSKIEALIVMLAFQADDGSLTREIMLYSKDGTKTDGLAVYLRKTELDLRPSDTVDDEMRVYEQGNSKASRKQVAPLVENWFNDLK